MKLGGKRKGWNVPLELPFCHREVRTEMEFAVKEQEHALRSSPSLLPVHEKVLSIAPLANYKAWIVGRESTYEARNTGFVLGKPYLADLSPGHLWLCCRN